MPPQEGPISTDPFATDEHQEAAAPPSWWQQHPKTAQLVKGTLNTLPMAGAMAGGAIATPETLGAGTVAGSALGAGVGRGARDLLAEGLGLEEKSSPLAKGSRIALDTAITAAAPAIISRVKDLITKPGATVADLIDVYAHPQGTADKAANSLRALSETRVPSANEGFTLPQAKPVRLPNGEWGVESVNAGEELKPGTTVRVNAADKSWIQTVPHPVDPMADVRAAQIYMNSGLSPSQAAAKASEGSAARFAAIMSHIMNSGGVK